MTKRFNTTGVCIPKKHYMVDISHKIDEIEKLISQEFYFVINRPRQFGKTTTLNELYKRLNSKYKVIRMDFELIGEDFSSEERRLDIVIQYNKCKYVIETKIWYGDKAHSKGLNQLKNYLEIEGLSTGYLLIFNFNENKQYSSSRYSIEDKDIFEVVV